MTCTIFLSNFKRNGVRHFYFFYLLHQFSFLVEFDVFGGFFAFSSSIRHCAVLFCAKCVGIPLAYDCWDWLLFAAIQFRDTYYTPLGWPIQTRKRDIKRNKSKVKQTKLNQDINMPLTLFTYYVTIYIYLYVWLTWCSMKWIPIYYVHVHGIFNDKRCTVNTIKH